MLCKSDWFVNNKDLLFLRVNATIPSRNKQIILLLGKVGTIDLVRNGSLILFALNDAIFL